MVDHLPPPHPPPPPVPKGWAVRWDKKYEAFYYVNEYTKVSQWEKPTDVARPDSGSDLRPAGPPPAYDGREGSGSGDYSHDSKQKPSGSNPDTSRDEEYARRLQEEEMAQQRRSGSNQKGAADDYYNASSSNPGPQYPPQTQTQYFSQPQQLYPVQNAAPQTSGKKGFLSSIFGGKNKPHPQQHYGGYPQQFGGGYPSQQYGYPHQYGGHPQQMMPPRKGGGGMGFGTGLFAGAAGVGAAMIGSELIEHEIDRVQEDAYRDGYEDGRDRDDEDFDDGGFDDGGFDDGGFDDGGFDF